MSRTYLQIHKAHTGYHNSVKFMHDFTCTTEVTQYFQDYKDMVATQYMI